MTTIPDSSALTDRSVDRIFDDTDSTLVWAPSDDSRRARWPWWVVAAGVTGLASNLTSMGATTAEEDPDPLVVVENLPRLQYHVSFVFGLTCAAALVIAVTALRPWVERRAPGRLGARVIPNALSITATLAVISACTAGSLALYLPGGLDDGTMWVEGLAASYYFLDFGALIGWWGAVLAASCALPLSFGEDRVLPRWLGVATVPLVAIPLLAAAATGLPGLPGLTMPIWMIAFGAALTRRTA